MFPCPLKLEGMWFLFNQRVLPMWAWQLKSRPEPSAAPSVLPEDGGASSIPEVGMSGMSKGASLTRVNLTPTMTPHPPSLFYTWTHKQHVRPTPLTNTTEPRTSFLSLTEPRLTGPTERRSTPFQRDHLFPRSRERGGGVCLYLCSWHSFNCLSTRWCSDIRPH